MNMGNGRILTGIILSLAWFSGPLLRAEDAPPKPPDEAAPKPDAPAVKPDEPAVKPPDPAAPKAEAPKVDKEAVKKEMDGIRTQMKDLATKIEGAKRKIAQSPEMAPAYKAMSDARKVYDDKLNAKVAADADGGQYVKQLAELRTKQTEFTNKLAEVKKKLAQDPELVEAQKAIMDAQKAYNDKVTSKLAADPDGAAIQKQFEESKTQMIELGPKIAEAKKKLVQDPEVVEAQKGIDAANKAYQQELINKVAADADAGASVKQNDELKAKLDELGKKLK